MPLGFATAKSVCRELELEELDPEEEPFVADRSIPKNVKDDVDIVDRRRNSRRCCVSFPGWASLPLLCNVILISLLLLQLPDVKDFAFVQSMMHLANSPISSPVQRVQNDNQLGHDCRKPDGNQDTSGFHGNAQPCRSCGQM